MKKAIIAALGLAATLGLSSCSTAASSGGSGQATNFTQLLPMIAIYVLLFAALYFFMIRPNSKKKKQEEQLRNSLEIGDELITIGGITGRVVSIKDLYIGNRPGQNKNPIPKVGYFNYYN